MFETASRTKLLSQTSSYQVQCQIVQRKYSLLMYKFLLYNLHIVNVAEIFGF